MQFTIDNKNYKFIPSHIVSIDSIINYEKTLDNDIYEKYEASANISGELIICNDVSKMKNKTIKLFQETYSDYVKYIKTRDYKKDVWIYNIIDGISEQHSILFKDEKCIIIPTITWNSTNLDKLHILCIPTDKTLRCIRSLESCHIPLLEHMRNVSLQTIKNKYGLDECFLKVFFHYEPSTYHLHIHFVNIMVDTGSSIEYSHELNNVIFNLTLDSNYYKKAILYKRG